MISWLAPDEEFPPLESALSEPDGLLAAGADLSPQRLLKAYRLGIFPWYAPGQPILWWSPDPRMVLRVADFRMPRSLVKKVRQAPYVIRADTAFRAVMDGCAGPRAGQEGTWIVPEMIAAYCALHEMGFAHSIEAWADGRLAGGLYGVAIGRMFYGESMFARAPDASKIALAHLVRHLAARRFPLVDCQQETAHLARFGARPMPRATFACEIAALVNCDEAPGSWTHIFNVPPQ